MQPHNQQYYPIAMQQPYAYGPPPPGAYPAMNGPQQNAPGMHSPAPYTQYPPQPAYPPQQAATYPPSSTVNSAEPPMKPSTQMQMYNSAPPTAATGGSTPPATGAGSPASFSQPYIVPGYPAAAAPMPPAYATAAHTVGNEPCACSAGWVLFGVGWVFPICWFVGVFLPLCSKDRNDRRAAIGSGVMLAVTIIVTILAVVIPLSILAAAASSQLPQSNQTGSPPFNLNTQFYFNSTSP